MVKSKPFLLFLITFAFTLSQIAFGQVPDPYQGLMFESNEHQAWFQVFWEGRCDPLGGLALVKCRATKLRYDFPGFNAVLDRASTSYETVSNDTLEKMWKLGKEIGFEWARDNGVDCFSNDDVFLGERAWARQLELATADTLATILDQVEAEVKQKLNDPPDGRVCLAKLE